MKRYTFFLSCIALLSFSALQAQCPGCLINLPAGLQDDTLFISHAPDGMVLQYYEEDLSFRMPMSTTPVASIDSTTPPGLPISQMSITNVSNLPPGLSWEASQLVFNTGEMETDGCVKICGTPLVSDSFAIQVEVEAVVFGFPNPASFSVPIYIAPAMANTEGFSMTGNVDCGSATVSFQNEIPSNGNPGYTYFWDFGNGNTSSQENPPPQTYDEAGTYTVNYTATIDTAGYYLTQVVIFGTDCSDFNIPPADKPDLFIKIFDPQNNEIYTSDVLQNTDLPAYFSLYLPISSGNYTIEVWDDELIGTEFCGNVNFNQNTTGTLYDDALSVEINIYHPITTVEANGQVIVYEQPEAPQLSWLGDTHFCQGDSLIIGADYQTGLQWYRDSMPLQGDTLAEITIHESGNYWVVYTSEDGCSANSEVIEVVVYPLPETPVFDNTDNWLSLSANPEPEIELQWYYEDQVLEGETGDSLCILQSGTYGLLATNSETGCTSFFSAYQEYNPDMPCNVPTTSIEEQYDFNISPNPFTDRLLIRWNSPQAGQWNWSLLQFDGREVLRGNWTFSPGPQEREIQTRGLPQGMYLLRIRTPQGVLLGKLLKVR